MATPKSYMISQINILEPIRLAGKELDSDVGRVGCIDMPTEAPDSPCATL